MIPACLLPHLRLRRLHIERHQTGQIFARVCFTKVSILGSLPHVLRAIKLTPDIIVPNHKIMVVIIG